jgi:TetR/AcrR family transcriptional regulator, transcriptional repressor for nem operon
MQMSKSEVTRAFIIEKAAPIFNQKGYAGTSLNDMTQATNLTKGSIYGNFENKDAVALAAFDYNLEKVNAIIAGEMSKYDSAREKLLVYGRIYTNYLNYPFPVGGCPVLNTAIEADDTHPELKSKATAAINSWKKKIISILDIGIENKEFNKTIDTEQIALTILALIEGGIMISKVTGKVNYRSAIMKSLTEFINGIK